jgi:hypothetical protein
VDGRARSFAERSWTEGGRGWRSAVASGRRRWVDWGRAGSRGSADPLVGVASTLRAELSATSPLTCQLVLLRLRVRRSGARGPISLRAQSSGDWAASRSASRSRLGTGQEDGGRAGKPGPTRGQGTPAPRGGDRLRIIAEAHSGPVTRPLPARSASGPCARKAARAAARPRPSATRRRSARGRRRSRGAARRCWRSHA